MSVLVFTKKRRTFIADFRAGTIVLCGATCMDVGLSMLCLDANVSVLGKWILFAVER